MCLYTNQHNPRKTDKPIRCLKVVEKISPDNANPTIGISCFKISVIEPCIYTIGKRTEMKKDDECKMIHTVNYTFMDKTYMYMIDNGLHSFKIDDSEPWKPLIAWMISKKRNPALLLCEIPAGTLYFEGIHNCISVGEPGYVSEVLDVISEISVKKYQSIQTLLKYL